MSKPMTVDETYRFWKQIFDHLEITAGCFVVADEMEAVEPETPGVLMESAAQDEPQNFLVSRH